MKRITLTCILGLIICSFVCSCSFVGCAQRAPELRALVVLKTLQNPYFQEMRRGIMREAEAKLPGVTIDIKSGAAEGDAAGQRQVLEEYANTYLSKQDKVKLVGVIITPASSGPELVPILTRYIKAGCPVVTLDTTLVGSSSVLTNAYSAFRGSDNKLGGSIAGEEIRRLLPNGGHILLLNGLDGHETAIARRSGFLSQFTGLSQYSVTERTCNWDRNEARATVTALLDAGQVPDAIFAANDEMALGALESRRQKGLSNDKMPIFGFDATEEARAAVTRKDLRGTVAQKPADMGASGVDVLSDLISGKPVERDRFIPVQLVDR